VRYLDSIASKVKSVYRSTGKPTKVEIISYKDPVLVEEIVTKTDARSLELKKNAPLTIPEIHTATGLMMLSNRDHSRVIDLGGGAGTHLIR
jgi:hypothetical protein